jgi:hypothetical protein
VLEHAQGSCSLRLKIILYLYLEESINIFGQCLDCLTLSSQYEMDIDFRTEAASIPSVHERMQLSFFEE